MDAERTIGRVIKVSTYRVLVELNADTTSYVRSCHGGLYTIAQINSFVILPIGSERVVAAVTGLDMAEESQAEFTGRTRECYPSRNPHDVGDDARYDQPATR